ncbi:MAG TPA: hypothetical protein VMF33_03850, partial [Acidimicrobiales bacterium]|nr:hypothetical protein [Acidimicrobiales bacterium]
MARPPRATLWGLGAALVLTSLVVTPVPASAASRGGTLVPGTDCPAFPANNVWNTPVTTLPVNANSVTWLAAMDAAS